MGCKAFDMQSLNMIIIITTIQLLGIETTSTLQSRPDLECRCGLLPLAVCLRNMGESRFTHTHAFRDGQRPEEDGEKRAIAEQE